MAMAAAATSERDPVATWTYFELAQQLWADGLKVSVSQLWRILTAMDIRLDRVRGWAVPRPARAALVLSVEEKTSIQAKQRRYPDQACAAGRPAGREFEYVRHLTASLVAALVSTVALAARAIERNNSSTFGVFLDSIDAESIPPWPST